MKNTLISCNSISASYDGVNVLKDLSFSVNEKDYLCIEAKTVQEKALL